MRQWGRRLARVAAIVVVLGMATVVVAAWRLASGPIELPALTPHLERALSWSDGSIVTHISTSEIAWDARDREVELVVHDLRVGTTRGQLLYLPAAALTFSAWHLLAGRLVLRTVDLPEPRLTLHSGLDGTFRLGLGGDVTRESSLGEFLPALIAPRPEGPLAELRRLQVSGGEVTMATGAGPAWRLLGVEWTFTRTPRALSITGQGRFESGATAMPIEVDGALDVAARPATFTAKVTGGALAPRDVLAFWPAGIAREVRDWIDARVEGGGAQELRLGLGGRIAGDGAIDVDAVDGRFKFMGLTVRPLNGVPPVTGVAGRATFDQRRWRFQVARGQSGGLDVADGTVEIASSDPPTVSIRTTVRGTIERALPLVRQYTGNEGFVAVPATGRLLASVALDVTPGRPFDPQRLSARGSLQDVACPDVVGSRSLSGGDLTFEIARRLLVVRGRAKLDGVPGDLSVTTPTDRFAPAIEVNARLDAAGRAALGLDVGRWVDGVTPVQGKVTMDAQAPARAVVSAELRDAALSVPALGIQKPPGVPGTSSATLRVAGGAVTRIDDAVLRYDATELRGRAGFDRAGTLESLAVDGTLGPVPGRKAPSRITLRVVPGPAQRTVTATTDDVDLLSRALGMNADAEGGELRFDGALAPGSGLGVEGQVEARDFTLASAPVLARLLAMTSVPGVKTLFTGRGLPVTRLAARIAYRPPTITLTDGVLESRSLGVRLAGTAHTRGTIALHGSLVPSYYGLNALPGRVPVLGRVITGGKREGLQVFEFDVRGTTAAPTISVEPISSLAPGAIRDLLKLLPQPRVPVPGR